MRRLSAASTPVTPGLAAAAGALWVLCALVALRCATVDAQEYLQQQQLPLSPLLKDFSDPSDDPASPDYRLTAEHYPRYLLPSPSAGAASNVNNDGDSGVNSDTVVRPQQSSDSGRFPVPQPQALRVKSEQVVIREDNLGDIQFIAIVAGCSTLAAFLIVSSGYCVYRVHQNQQLVQDVEYPAYGVTGPMKNTTTSPASDRKLAQSAQMYHFQHQKQQMIAVEKNEQAAVLPSPANRRGSNSEVESDDEDKDFTVYECPGLAPGGQMEVRNPLFNEKKAGK